MADQRRRLVIRRFVYTQRNAAGYGAARLIVLRQTFTVVIRPLQRMFGAWLDCCSCFVHAGRNGVPPQFECRYGSLRKPRDNLAVLPEDLCNLQGGLAERTQSSTRSSRGRRALCAPYAPFARSFRIAGAATRLSMLVS